MSSRTCVVDAATRSERSVLDRIEDADVQTRLLAAFGRDAAQVGSMPVAT